MINPYSGEQYAVVDVQVLLAGHLGGRVPVVRHLSKMLAG